MKIIKLNEIIRPRNYDDYTLYFSDYSYLEGVYTPNCCEENYADWSCLDDTGFFDKDIYELTFVKWEYGFKINGYPVNCYSEQNGNYSNTIDLKYIRNDGTVEKVFTALCQII